MPKSRGNCNRRLPAGSFSRPALDKRRPRAIALFPERRAEEGTGIIIGIGSDLANIERIGRTIERFGARFLDRVYTETEQALAERRRERVATYAKRWAAKEACSKALGTGLRMGIKWRDMGVVNLRIRPADAGADRLGGGAAAHAHAGRAAGARASHPDRRPPLGDGGGGDRDAAGG